MPSPVGHALGGAVVAALLTRAPSRPLANRGSLGAGRRWRSPVAVAMLAGCAPDIDFLWARHNMETHSLGAAVLAGLLAWAWLRSGRMAVVVALAWTTHVAFDWLGSDDTPPLGVMALWPGTSTFYFAHAYVFEAISRRYWLSNFWAHNLWAVATEFLMLGPPAALALWWRMARAAPTAAAQQAPRNDAM